MQGMKKDCVLFINRLKANREQAEINKKRADRAKDTNKITQLRHSPIWRM